MDMVVLDPSLPCSPAVHCSACIAACNGARTGAAHAISVCGGASCRGGAQSGPWRSCGSSVDREASTGRGSAPRSRRSAACRYENDETKHGKQSCGSQAPASSHDFSGLSRLATFLVAGRPDQPLAKILKAKGKKACFRLRGAASMCSSLVKTPQLYLFSLYATAFAPDLSLNSGWLALPK